METPRVGLPTAVTQAAKIQRPTGADDHATFPNPSEATKETTSQRSRPVQQNTRINSQTDPFAQTVELPLSILKDVQVTHAEWAWRRVLNDALATSQAAAGQKPSEAAPDAAVQGLWNLLDELSAHADEWQVLASFPGAPGEGLVSFAAIQSSQLNTLPDMLQQWILRDRIVHGVSDASAHVRGGGLFAPHAHRVEQNTLQRPRQWVRWQGERQSMVQPAGDMIHRLQLTLRVGEVPCHVEMICAKPWLTVHIGANDEPLRARIADSGERVRNSLVPFGWNLERWSVGPLGAEGENES